MCKLFNYNDNSNRSKGENNVWKFGVVKGQIKIILLYHGEKNPPENRLMIVFEIQLNTEKISNK